MATTVDNYKIKVTVEGREGLKNLKKDMEDFGSYGGPMQNSINGIISRLGPLGLAAGVAGTAFVALGGYALRTAAELSDVAGSSGIAASQLMSLKASIIEAGGNADDFATIANKLNQSVQEASGGNEKLQDAFKTLGVYVRDANGQLRPTGDILNDITAKARAGELVGQKYAAAIDIVGKNLSKIDPTQLNSLRDSVKDEQIKKLDEYDQAIDRVKIRVSEKIVTFFGQLALDIEKASKAHDELEAKLNQQGKGQVMPEVTGTIRGILGLPPRTTEPPITRTLSEQEKADAARRKREEEMARLMSPYKSRAGIRAEGQGDFGPTPESVLKAREASAKRIQDSIIETQRQGDLQLNTERLNAIMMFADKRSAIEQKAESQIKDLRINSDAEIKKAKLDIFAQEKLSQEEKEKELAQKTLEINAKLASDIARVRGQSAEQLDAEDKRIQDIITQSKARVVEEEALNELLAKKNKFFTDNATATDRERQRAQELFDLEEERLKILRQIALIKDIPPEERMRREQEINDIFDKRRILTEQQQSADQKLQENFNAGFVKAYRQYVEDSQNAFEQAGRLFKSVTSSFEENLTQSLAKGKLLYKEFFLDVVQQLIRSNIQNLIGQIFGGVAGASRLNTTSNIFKSLLGFANGGIIPTNSPVVVGERGPELLVGASGNRVIPNNQLGGASVTYNINAVDAMSFKSMLAADPSFLYAVTEQGRRRLPGVA